MLNIILTVIATILSPAIVAIASFVYKNRKKSIRNRQKIEIIEQRLFGLEDDDTDKGALQDMQKQMSMIEAKLDFISKQIDDNEDFIDKYDNNRYIDNYLDDDSDDD